jgi:regulator of protease activity HflC (stomatin/prohibitin superfamily)
VAQETKAVTAQYSVTDLTVNRGKIANEIRTRIGERLAKHSVVIEDINLENINFPEDFNKAVRERLKANQEALAAQERVKKSEAEARQKVAEAEGEAQSTIARAKGQAEANRLLAESLTAEVLRSREIDNQAEMIKKISDLNKQAQVVYLPNSILGIGSLPATAKP